MEKEIRVYDVELEVRATENKSGTLRGLAIPYNKMSEDMGFREVIKEGACQRALSKNPDLLALYEHNYSNLLGRSSNNTLRFEETERGLEVEIDLPETSLGKDLEVLIGNRTLSKMSFGFSTGYDSTEWSEMDDGTDLRTINHIDNLYEVSIVSTPAYEDTEVAKRCLGKCKAKRDKDLKQETPEQVEIAKMKSTISDFRNKIAN